MYLGETTRITIEDVSNCSDCLSLYQVDPPFYCYADHDWLNGLVVLDVHWSLITSISFRMGDQELMQPKLPTFQTGPRTFEASVCVKGGECEFCGSVISEELFLVGVPGWEPRENIFCEVGIEGNEVRLTQVGNYGELTQPCNAEVYGQGWFGQL